MRPHDTHDVRRRIALTTALIVAALSSPRSAADPMIAAEFRGACYCRVDTQLMCTANLTDRECDLISKQTFCDEWFWKERLPCWNWGYGG
jgi:hypothetical protein